MNLYIHIDIYVNIKTVIFIYKEFHSFPTTDLDSLPVGLFLFIDDKGH